MDDNTLADHLLEIKATLLTITKFVLTDIARRENVETKDIFAMYKKTLNKQKERLARNPNASDWPDILDTDE
jgi:hypothetical protein